MAAVEDMTAEGRCVSEYMIMDWLREPVDTCSASVSWTAEYQWTTSSASITYEDDGVTPYWVFDMGWGWEDGDVWGDPYTVTITDSCGFLTGEPMQMAPAGSGRFDSPTTDSNLSWGDRLIGNWTQSHNGQPWFVNSGDFTYVGDGVGNDNGLVDFTWEMTDFKVGSREVRFDPSKSDLPEGATIQWHFGDGTSATRGTTTPFTHQYPTFGEYHPTALLVCGGGCEPSADTDRVVVDPITTYSPQLRLHPTDDYKPARPGWFAKHSNLKWNLSDCKDKTVDKTPSLARLGGNGAKPYTARQHYSACRFGYGKTYRSDQLTRPYNDTGKPKGLAQSEGFYLTLDNKKKIRKGEGTGIDMAYNAKSRDYITYWFFYAYDPKADGASRRFFSHEGDWERLTVRLDDHNRARKVGYFQHTCAAEMYSWDEMQSEDFLTEDTHPVAYSAKGAHASYPITQSFSGGVCEEKSGPLAALEGRGDVTRDGGPSTYWSPWETGLTNAKNQPWYGFGGAWGEVGAPSITGHFAKNHSTGPLGPHHKDPGTLSFD